MGPPKIISGGVLDQVRSLTAGYVARITGFSPAEVAVNFARFFAPTTSLFGWGRWSPDDGQAFTFVSGHRLVLVPVSSIPSHMRKHTPLTMSTRSRCRSPRTST